ncbi:eukaryotic translation initiation factor 3 subunit I-like [Lineus longissimus]|uniref:eukaryotic translation initiation factor 3 subunit I-like n=1 Tax=Lineus longissimus TaxID=88925 RepID=UPI002B4D29A6
MKPLMLHGHERSITQIKYNREGDLLFSCSKDHIPNIWYALNGERLGTLKGHQGAIWCMDPIWDTSKTMTGSADNTCKVWDTQTGTCVATMETRTAVRTCGFSYSGKTLMYSTDKTMGHPCEIHLYDVNDDEQIRSNKPYMVMSLPMEEPKITSAIWSHLDDQICAGHEDGSLSQWDVRMGKQTYKMREHNKQINDIQLSKDTTMVITASKDTKAKIFDCASLEPLKTYKTDRPVNSAAISPTKDHVVLGGGQEAMDVTTTSTRVGKFDARFFHLILEEEFGRVKGHFGPINSLAFSPDGKGYSSGAEDGYVRVHQFDPEYFEFEYEY